MPLDDAATRIVDVRGLELAFQHLGDGEPIVLIRGLGTQLIEWSQLLVDGLVAGGLGVVVFDNRDAGRSAKLSDDYPLSAMAQDTVALMTALGFSRFHVFGISLGGMIAQRIAIDCPQHLGCLFSVMSTSSAPGLPGAGPEIRARLQVSASERAQVIAMETENRAVFGSPGYPESLALRRRLSAAAYDRCFSPDGVARQMRAAIADADRAEALSAIAAPALVIHGADDPLIPPACGVDTAERIPAAEYVEVPGMGHNIPDALAPHISELVVQFIARQRG